MFGPFELFQSKLCKEHPPHSPSFRISEHLSSVVLINKSEQANSQKQEEQKKRKQCKNKEKERKKMQEQEGKLTAMGTIRGSWERSSKNSNLETIKLEKKNK